MAAVKTANTSRTSKPKTSKATDGAPSQHNQSSRKGKKAWRKNVDIQEVEEALEGMREEERVIGTTLQKLPDSELFAVDVQGDAKARKAMKFSGASLTSTKILSQRSAVPAVFSRPSTSTKRKHTLSHEEKERLLRIGKRPRKGPFNSVVDPRNDGEGSALAEVSEAVKQSGQYDVWGPNGQDDAQEDELGLDTVQKKTIRPPSTTQHHPSKNTLLPAVEAPHQGASYNPPVEAHQELLQKAYEEEQKRIREETRFKDVKERMHNARIVDDADDGAAARDGAPPGMTVQPIEEDEEQEEKEGADEVPVRKAPVRKTKAQRAKAAKLLAEKRAFLAQTQNKRLNASITQVQSLSRTSRFQLASRQSEAHLRKVLRLEKLRKQGLKGTKIGRHKVPEDRTEVQLGEDLSESFRGMKAEGNLLRDRFQSMQQRALIEPRTLVMPKKRRLKMKDYEKPAWRKFE